MCFSECMRSTKCPNTHTITIVYSVTTNSMDMHASTAHCLLDHCSSRLRPGSVQRGVCHNRLNVKLSPADKKTNNQNVYVCISPFSMPQLPSLLLQLPSLLWLPGLQKAQQTCTPPNHSRGVCILVLNIFDKLQCLVKRHVCFFLMTQSLQKSMVMSMLMQHSLPL